MYKRPLLPLIFALLIALSGQALAESSVTPGEPLVYSRVIDVPGLGLTPYYAQNDPLWREAVYEPFTNDNFRTFGSAGCGPTAVAMAVAKQLSGNDLLRLNAASREEGFGFPYCVCSVNGHQCDLNHERITPTTADDFAERLPTIIGCYAAGNNPRREKFRDQEPGTSYHLFESIADAYGLPYKRVRDWETASQLIQAGWGAVTSVTAGVFTTSSHYLFIAHMDNEWIYILDPYMRDNYDELDRHHILEVLEPGLVRARLENLKQLKLSTFYMIGPEGSMPADDAQTDEHHHYDSVEK